MKIFGRVKELSLALIQNHPSSHRCRHFTFILNGNQILKIGFNKDKTHPRNLQFNYCNRRGESMSDQIGVHSEMDAIIKLGNTDCSGLILINTRINRNNKFDMSKPCSGCLNMIRSLNFKKIYYINKSGLFESI